MRLLAMLLFLSPGPAAALRCVEVFQGTAPGSFSVISRELLAVTNGDFVPVSDKNTVALIGTVQDPQGRSLLVLEKIGDGWTSAYTPTPVNYQGDPRNLARILGPQAAARWGFWEIGPNQMSVPGPEVMNENIKKSNRYLISQGAEPLVGGFYLSEVATPEFQNIYLDHYLHEGTLPVAKSGHYLFHDVAYHYSAVFLPRELLQASQTHVKYALLLKDYLRKNASDKDESFKAYIEKVVDLAMTDIEKQIDFGTGNTSLLLIGERRNLSGYDDISLAKKIIQQLTYGGKSSREYILSQWIKMLDTEEAKRSMPFSIHDVNASVAIQKAMRDQAQTLVEKFVLENDKQADFHSAFEASLDSARKFLEGAHHKVLLLKQMPE